MPKEKNWKERWLAEEAAAHIHGWDFSHLEGRYAEEDSLPWDYRALALEILRPEYHILDMETGGGEFLLSLGHPHENTAATEGYPPNVTLCREKLTPLGIDFRRADGDGALPFPDGSFDVILNRHGAYRAEEIWRCLKPGGVFLTQQVGSRNDRELAELLLPGTPEPFPEQTLARQREVFEKAGFTVLRGEEAFGPIRFFDVGALVWFARVIPWEFPGFSVEGCFDRLLLAQQELEARGEIGGTTHRFLLMVRK